MSSIAALLTLTVALAADCLSYAPGSATVEGELSRKTFPGPPNYASISSGDREETYYLIELASPRCVSAGDDADGLERAIANVEQMQLILSGQAAYDNLRAHLGSQVRCRGSLVGAISGHHHSPVLLEVTDCEPTSPPLKRSSP